jgi:hypothetical protein
VQDKQAEAKAVLQRAEQARAEQPENQGLTAADWSDQRDKIMAAQKTIAYYDGTFFAMVQELDRPHQEIHACVSTRLRVRVRPPDCGAWLPCTWRARKCVLVCARVCVFDLRECVRACLCVLCV